MIYKWDIFQNEMSPMQILKQNNSYSLKPIHPHLFKMKETNQYYLVVTYTSADSILGTQNDNVRDNEIYVWQKRDQKFVYFTHLKNNQNSYKINSFTYRHSSTYLFQCSYFSFVNTPVFGRHFFFLLAQK